MVSVSFATTTETYTNKSCNIRTKINKDDKYPSLNVIDAKEDEARGKPQAGRIDPDEIRMSENLALHRAYILHQRAYSLPYNYQQDARAFFRDPEAESAAPSHKQSQEHTEALEPRETSCLTVGTDCSGMEAPIQALHHILGDKFDHVFSCDNDPLVVKTIEANFPPTTIFPDIKTRDNDKAPEVDIYVAGFPCQSFSQAGKQQGFDDEKGRGTIFYNVLDYIEKRRPRIFVLENVKGLVTLDGGKYLRQILKALNGVLRHRFGPAGTDGVSRIITTPAYEIHHQVLNTKDSGIPQSRPRWYCVGIRKDTFQGYCDESKSTFEFPRPIPCPSIELLLDASGTPSTEAGTTVRSNISNAHKRILEAGHDPNLHSYIVDCDASTAKSRSMLDVSPCITRSRYKGHWIMNQNRRMTKQEMFRLQGMDPTAFSVAISDNSLGHQIGNAMSVNVIERVLLRALQAATKLKSGVTLGHDRWEHGTALEELTKSKGKPFRSQPSSGSNHYKPSRTFHRLMASSSMSTLRRRELMIDSGASYHIVGKKELTAEERKMIRKLADPIPLSTANGPTWATEETDIYVHELDIWVVAVLLEDSPAVLCQGKLVEHHGFRFDWTPGQTPYLQKGDLKVHCYPSHDVPFITTSIEDDQALPSPAHQEEPPLANVAPDETAPVQEPSVKGNLKQTPEKVQAKVLPPQKSSPGKPVSPKVKQDKVKANRKAKKKISSCQLCEHNVFTHFPKDPNCPICQGSKAQRARCSSKAQPAPDGLPEPKIFGDAITADHKILNEDDESRDHDRVACVIQDRATYWLQAYAAGNKSGAETKKAFQKFLGPQGAKLAKHVYSDNSKEIKFALDELGISQDTSTPHRPETNGIAERAVQRVKEGISCTLSQSGFTEAWWVEAMDCYCLHRNIVDTTTTGQTAYHNRFVFQDQTKL